MNSFAMSRACSSERPRWKSWMNSSVVSPSFFLRAFYTARSAGVRLRIFFAIRMLLLGSSSLREQLCDRSNKGGG